MYVAITGKDKSRVVQFCEQHRIAKTNKKKTVVVKTIGNYEALLRENPNIGFIETNTAWYESMKGIK